MFSILQDRRGCNRVLVTVLLALTSYCSVAIAAAAEIRGVVSIKNTGLFHAEGDTGPVRISVTALPLDAQTLPETPEQVHVMVLEDKQLQPAFMTIQKGDYIEFVNKDPVYHELFSLSKGAPVAMQLGKAGTHGMRRAVQFAESAEWRLFCRIHSKMYARVDVIDSPYIRMMDEGGDFAFDGLDAGEWQIRVAAPGAVTSSANVMAMIAPPPVQIDLYTLGGSWQQNRTGRDHSRDLVETLYPEN